MARTLAIKAGASAEIARALLRVKPRSWLRISAQACVVVTASAGGPKPSSAVATAEALRRCERRVGVAGEPAAARGSSKDGRA